MRWPVLCATFGIGLGAIATPRQTNYTLSHHGILSRVSVQTDRNGRCIRAGKTRQLDIDGTLDHRCTCHRSFRVGSARVGRGEECTLLCAAIPHCRFAFVGSLVDGNVQRRCNLYSNCSRLGRTAFGAGSTYERVSFRPVSRQKNGIRAMPRPNREAFTLSEQWAILAVLSCALWAVADVITDVCIEEELQDGASTPEDHERTVAVGEISKTTIVAGQISDSISPAKSSPMICIKTNDVLPGIPLPTAFPSKTSKGHRVVEKKDLSRRTRTNIGSLRRRSPTRQLRKVERDSHPIVSKVEHDSTCLGMVEVTDNGKCIGSVPYLTPEQDVVISGVFSGFVVTILLSARWLSRVSGQCTHEPSWTGLACKPIWSSELDWQWWAAAPAGLLLLGHYMFFMKAFERASSTLITPLVQVTGSWVILGASGVALATGDYSRLVSPKEAVCYVVIIVGGLLPAVRGELSRLFRAQFWTQPFVACVAIGELTLGIYELILSSATHASRGSHSRTAVAAEFFLASRCWFVAWFVVAYAVNPGLRRHALAISHVSRRVIGLSFAAEALCLAAFVCSAEAYALSREVSVLHAVESALGQAFNLLFAYVLKAGFGYGRRSALEGLGVKLLSLLVVTIGLAAVVAVEDELEAGQIPYDAVH